MPSKHNLTAADRRWITAELTRQLSEALSEAVNLIIDALPAENDRTGGYDGATSVLGYDEDDQNAGARRHKRPIGFTPSPTTGQGGTPDARHG